MDLSAVNANTTTLTDLFKQRRVAMQVMNPSVVGSLLLTAAAARKKSMLAARYLSQRAILRAELHSARPPPALAAVRSVLFSLHLRRH
jgi:hypothetical protein